MKIFLSILLMLFASCNVQQNRLTNEMMIVFSTGNIKITNSEGVIKESSVGAIVSENDVVTTENGTVDMQSRNGISVRVKPFTTTSINKLFNPTEMTMRQGSLIVSVDKNKVKVKGLSIITPTAIAGVRGTTFYVSSLEDSSSIRVVEGRVSVKERKTGTEQVVESGHNGIVSKEKVVVEKEPITIAEKAETMSLATVDISKSVEEIVSERQRKQQEISVLIQKEVEKSEIKTEQGLIKQYNKFEIINTHDGKIVRGVIVSQIGDVLIVHTTKGVVRMNKKNIAEVIYK